MRRTPLSLGGVPERHSATPAARGSTFPRPGRVPGGSGRASPALWSRVAARTCVPPDVPHFAPRVGGPIPRSGHSPWSRWRRIVSTCRQAVRCWPQLAVGGVGSGRAVCRGGASTTRRHIDGRCRRRSLTHRYRSSDAGPPAPTGAVSARWWCGHSYRRRRITVAHRAVLPS